VLDVLRNNSKLDELYRDTCLKAFAFCTKYKRVVEFRRLCEILRNHIQAQTKVDPRWKDKEMPTAEAMQTHLETRFSQLNTAIDMQLWQEAYRTVEDVHAMLAMMPTRPKAKPMAAYHAQLAKVFWVAGNKLFHAMALLRLVALTRTLVVQPSTTEMSALASRAVLAVLAAPLDPPLVDVNLLEYDLEHEKTKRMATMLAFPADLSREWLIDEVKVKGVLAAANPEVQQLFALTEGAFHPLDTGKRAQPLLESLEGTPTLAQYDEALRKLVGLRLLQQMERVYLTVKISSATEAICVLKWPEITDLILWAAKRELITLRIDEKLGQIRQRATRASASMSAEVRDTLTCFGAALQSVSERLHASDIQKRKTEVRTKLYGSFEASVSEEHEKILARRLIIERRKEEAERVAMEEEKERKRLELARVRAEEAEEKSRLEADRKARDEQRAEAARAEEEATQMRKLAEQMAEQRKNMKVTKKKTDEKGQKVVETSVDALATKDKAELMKEQRELIMDERQEFEHRLASMAKRHDHLERARREEERALLTLMWDKQQEADKVHHAEQAAQLKVQMKESRAHDLREKTRFARMSKSVEAFSRRVMAQRKEAHVQIVAQWKEEQARCKEQMAAERARRAAEEKAREEALEAARRAAEEEEARRIQEAAEAARKKAEAEEERKRVLEKQRQREKEMEEKAKREVLDAQAARLAEREKSGKKGWGDDDDDDDDEPDRRADERRGGTDNMRGFERVGGSRNEERWEGHRMGRDGPPRDLRDGVPPGRGGDRWSERDGDRFGGKGGGGDRFGGRDRFDERRDGDRFGGKGGGGDRFERRDDRGPPRDDGPPVRGSGFEPRGERRDGDRFGGKGGGGKGGDRDGPPRGGFGDRTRDGDRRGGGDGGAVSGGSWRR